MTLTELIARMREDLANGDARARELRVQAGERCEVRRVYVEALLRVADLLDAGLLDLPAADQIVKEATADAA
ncbi:hypothetical protein [Microtetraspora malaysiensis]|uniref:Uncharacterized protein n=1 Tax=Microtetraspora malaysiensis TaxID=161358 RepID=A0ABW6T355_9ACTN